MDTGNYWRHSRFVGVARRQEGDGCESGSRIVTRSQQANEPVGDKWCEHVGRRLTALRLLLGRNHFDAEETAEAA